MESISETKFDVVIAGTGLAQSLLALSLSREEKKILHIDKNAYYGGAEAAFSLQDAQDWVENLKTDPSRFSNAEISVPDDEHSKLRFSRSYSLALAPQIVYSKAALLPTLVSSKVYRQLEFLAVGAWWIYGRDNAGSEILRKIPGSREDVFADKSIGLKSKRALMKFLEFITDIDAYGQAMETWGEKSLQDFLTQEYHIPADLQPTLHALTLSPKAINETKTVYALPRILRHLSSIGVFGPGFGSIIPKWGGLAEVTQVACRACAVGGGVYMLGRKLSSPVDSSEAPIEFKLDDGQEVRTSWIAGGNEDMLVESTESTTTITRSISIVSSTLNSLFPAIADGAPPAACSIVVFPPRSLLLEDTTSDLPIYLVIHSSETGECPQGQTVVYGKVAVAADPGKQWLNRAISALLSSQAGPEPVEAKVLWSLSYTQEENARRDDPDEENLDVLGSRITFSSSSTDLVFDDHVLREVRKAWQLITGKTNGFMEFEDREIGEYDEDDG